MYLLREHPISGQQNSLRAPPRLREHGAIEGPGAAAAAAGPVAVEVVAAAPVAAGGAASSADPGGDVVTSLRRRRRLRSLGELEGVA